MKDGREKEIKKIHNDFVTGNISTEEKCKDWFLKNWERIYIITIISAFALIVYGISQSSNIFLSLGWLMFLVAGNIKINAVRLFGIGFMQKMSPLLLIAFNLLWLGWTIEFKTGWFGRTF